MTRLPAPPAPTVLAQSIEPADLIAVGSSTRLVRIFAAGGRHPQRWNGFRTVGPLPHAYFDPHPLAEDGSLTRDNDQGVLYFSLSTRTSVAEVFQDTATVDRHANARHLVILRPRRPLRLLDLTSRWPIKVGASAAIWSDTTDRTQAWARAIRAADPDLDGLWYQSAVDSGAPAICLWDPPAASALPRKPDVLLPLEHSGLELSLGRACADLGYTLAAAS
ncbi:RES family NAD+ phosphorylase [Crossiella sp. CA198]|uniref:RES family NAD+ phosphorylase n=1 Tax=Crossiella sp. CA198 TaxID=3455607 RepID=UPI003F8D6682